MTDRVMSIFAFATLVAYLGILIWYLPRLDLGAVVLLTLGLVAWDFFGPGERKL